MKIVVSSQADSGEGHKTAASGADHVFTLQSLHASAARSIGFAASREVVAEYDNSTKTIFLSDTWKGETAAELSVLVHEMVHHLQRRRGRPE